MILTGIIVSSYYFPIASPLLPVGSNTKMILALFGLACLCYNFIQNRVARIEKGILILTVYAVVVSIISIASMVVNHTPDSSYASYVVSMWVWFSAAYAVCFLIKSKKL